MRICRACSGPREWRWRPAPTVSPFIRGPTSAMSDPATYSRWPARLTVELNVEGNPFHGRDGDYPAFLPSYAARGRHSARWCRMRARNSLPTTGGTCVRTPSALRPIVAELRGWGCRVSLFMDADARAIGGARAVGADRIELYTEDYARAFERGDAGAELARYRDAALAARAPDSASTPGTISTCRTWNRSAGRCRGCWRCRSAMP